jgi:hypothetical protein
VLEAEGAADSPLAGVAVSGAPSSRPSKTVMDSLPRAVPDTARKFVRLCVKSGRFVTSGQLRAKHRLA